MADNPVLSRVKLPSGTIYDLKDAWAREQLASITSYTKYLGVTTTPITDGSTTSTIMIDGEEVTAQTGNIVIYGDKEFIFNGTAWQEFGDLSALKDELGNMAYVDSASTSYTPEGTIGATFTGTESTITLTGNVTGSMSAAFQGSEGTVNASGTVTEKTVVINGGSGTATYTPDGTISGSIQANPITVTYNYTPEGTLSAAFSGSQGAISASGLPSGIVKMASIIASLDGNYTPAGTVTVVLDKTPTTVNSLTSVGTSATFGLTSGSTIAVVDGSDGEQLNLIWNSDLFSFTPNALPTYTAVSVLSDVAVSSATFSGEKVLISASFEGTDTTFTGTFTPSGTITDATFTGSASTLTSTVTPTGSISATFSGTGTRLTGTVESQTVAVTGTFTPSGTVSGELSGATTTVTGSYTPSGSIGATFTGSSATITVSAPAHS